MAFKSTEKMLVKVGETYIIGVSDIPALGATPEKIDVTTLADSARQYIDGIKDYGDLEFTCFYDADPEGTAAKLNEGHPLKSKTVGNYSYLNGLKGVQEIVIELDGGETFEFSGKVSVAMAEASVNAALTFTMSVALASDIEFKAGGAGA